MTTLTTPRLVLRSLRRDDLGSLTAAVNDLRVARNLLRVPWPYDLDDARSYYDHTQALPKGSAAFAILSRAEPAMIVGMAGYESHDGLAELGYWLAAPFWGRGYMREATGAVLAHAFGTTRLDRLCSRCAIDNEASRRILIGLDFRPTGTDRVFSPVRRSAILTQTFELTVKEWSLLPNPSRHAKRQAS
ncbi:MAG: GNAT family N-acetyltransferase [Aestuariivirgaceae bacterium]